MASDNSIKSEPKRYLGWLDPYLPELPLLGAKERFRACAGACLGVFITGLIGLSVWPAFPDALWLVAPMGASSVILFTLPSSPLAQPWSILGGNLVCALIGITCSKLIEPTLLAAPLAVFLSIPAMFLLRCLHPPSGAVALICIIGGESIRAQGYEFLLFPLGLNTLCLITCAIFYNKLTGQLYPYRRRIGVDSQSYNSALQSQSASQNLASLAQEDISFALSEYNHLIDVNLEDLEEIFSRAQRFSYQRRTPEFTCEQIMSDTGLSFEYATPLDEAWKKMLIKNTQAIAVLGKGGQLLGMVTRSDFLNQLSDVHQSGFTRYAHQLKKLLQTSTSSHTDKPEVVGQIMRTTPKTVLNTSAALSAAQMMIEQGARHIPVINSAGHYLGMINQTDMIIGLYQSLLLQPENSLS